MFKIILTLLGVAVLLATVYTSQDEEVDASDKGYYLHNKGGCDPSDTEACWGRMP